MDRTSTEDAPRSGRPKEATNAEIAKQMHRIVSVLHDNAPSHTSLKAMIKLDQLRFELVAHPPYSPDLAPSNYYLFPNLKQWLQGKRFTSNEECIALEDNYVEE
ncbi:SETMR methyltransferase, partial [Acromyrmex insinuator]